MNQARHGLGWRLLLKLAAALVFATSLLLAGSGGAVASYISITSPAAGATVKGMITIATSKSSDVSWINVYVARDWVASNSPTALPPYSVTWNSTTEAKGNHMISATGYDSKNTAFAKARVEVKVSNRTQSTPTATMKPTLKPTSIGKPTAKPTLTVIHPAPTPAPVGHFDNIGPRTVVAPIRSDATCASLANQANFPETTPSNVNDGTGWDTNRRFFTTPTYFYTHAYANGASSTLDFQQ